VLAVPTRLFGPLGMALGSAALNAVSVVGIAVVARRRAGAVVGAVAVTVAAALSWTMGSTLLHDPWAPNVLMLVTLLFLLLVWSVADGDVVLLPVLAGVASLLVQTNLSYSLLAPVLAVFAVGAMAVRLRGERRRRPGAWPALRRRVRRAGIASAAVLVAVWTPPVIEQLTADDDGNLTRVVRGVGDQPLSLGPMRALRLVAGVTTSPGWLRGSFERLYGDPPGPTRAVVAALALALLLASVAWMAARRRDRVAVAAVATAAVALVLSYVTTVRSPVDGFGAVNAYRTRYLWPVAAFATLVVAVALVRRFARTARSRIAVAGALVTLTGVLSLANVAWYWPAHATHEPPYARPIVNDLRAQLADHVDPERTVFFNWQGGGDTYEYWASAMLAELADEDVPFEVPPGHLVRTLGEERRGEPRDADAEMTVLTGARAYDVPAGARRVALSEPLDPAGRRELARLRDQVVRAIDGGDLRLTAEGRKAVATLTGRPVSAFRLGDGRRLVEGDGLEALLVQGFFDFSGHQEAMVRRFVHLQDREDKRTVAVFLRPLRS
jgi:hypothetical protein